MTHESTFEKGYRPVLVQERTKQALQDFRRRLPDRDLAQERRLVTAALEMVLENSALHAEWIKRVSGVVLRDIQMNAAD